MKDGEAVDEPGMHADRPGNSGVPPPRHSRWKPGQSGNPSGKPKGFYPISKAVEDLLSWTREERAAFLRGEEESLPLRLRRSLKPAHEDARALFLRAQDPDNRSGVAAVIEIMDRTEGKVVQKTEATTVSLEDTIREVHARILARREKTA